MSVHATYSPHQRLDLPPSGAYPMGYMQLITSAALDYTSGNLWRRKNPPPSSGPKTKQYNITPN